MAGYCLLLCTSCSSLPSNWQAEVLRYGMWDRAVSGGKFTHVLIGHNFPAVFEKMEPKKVKNTFSNDKTTHIRNIESVPALHIYIEGDGIPWVDGGRKIALDPSPQRMLALELMSQDIHPSVYLGRPCYFVQTLDVCSPDVWTFGRYSSDVIASMVAVVRSIVDRLAVKKVVLIGYSGGGAIATLMAEHIPQSIALVTIAANLDTECWTSHHGYLPLTTSLNPVRTATLSSSLYQLHLVGGNDDNVPLEVIENFTQKHGGEIAIYKGFDHRCCWANKWPNVLEKIKYLEKDMEGHPL